MVTIKFKSNRANAMNPWYAESAQIFTRRRLTHIASVTANRASLLSATSAGVSAKPPTSPRVSTQACRLTPVIFFPPVVAAWPRLLRRAHGLAVGDARRRLGFSPLGHPHGAAQGILDLVPGTVLLPLAEVPEGAVPVRQVRRQCPPGAALADSVEDGIEDGPAAVLGWPPSGL